MGSLTTGSYKNQNQPIRGNKIHEDTSIQQIYKKIRK
jgi:hypothetical protein